MLEKCQHILRIVGYAGENFEQESDTFLSVIDKCLPSETVVFGHSYDDGSENIYM